MNGHSCVEFRLVLSCPLTVVQVLNGTCRITSLNSQGQNFVDDVGTGDLWYFPQGDPHSIQALGDGCSFLLIFDDG